MKTDRFLPLASSPTHWTPRKGGDHMEVIIALIDLFHSIIKAIVNNPIIIGLILYGIIKAKAYAR